MKAFAQLLELLALTPSRNRKLKLIADYLGTAGDPDRGYVTARDLRTIFFGKLNDVYAVPGSAVAKAPAPKGSSGFIFD